MPDLPDVPGKSPWLSRKILGVQVLYWLGIGVLVLAYVAYRIHSAPSDTPTDSAAVDGEPEDSGAAANGPGLYDGFSAQPTPTYDPSLGSTTTVETNESWSKKGVEWASQSGLVGAGEAQLILQKYLNGDQLSFEEGKVRDAIIAHFGAPPESITVGTTAAELAKRQGTPPTYHTVKGLNDNTYGKLIALYWGASTNDRVDLIQNANHSLGKSGPFPVGTRVFIPKYHAPKYYTSTKRTNTLREIAAKNGTTVTSLRILNDGIKDTLKSGTRVRVA